MLEKSESAAPRYGKSILTLRAAIWMRATVSWWRLMGRLRVYSLRQAVARCLADPLGILDTPNWGINMYPHVRRTPIREHFLRSGKPKRKFETEQEGKDFIRIRQMEAQMKVYECGFCKGWHLATRK